MKKKILQSDERRHQSRTRSPGGSDQVIRTELFSPEQFKRHAISLAQAQVADTSHSGHQLLPRLKENARVLSSSYTSISQAVNEHRTITPAAEWLIDNFHVIQEQLHDIMYNLPESYYRGLPKLKSGFLEGYPRVYGISWALIAHTDSCFDSELVTQFVKAYQNVQPLTLGELWALPLTLRVLLIENLRRLAILIRNAQDGRRLADQFIDDLLKTIDQDDPKKWALVGGVLPSDALRRSYVVQIAQRLHDPHPGFYNALGFLHEWLAEQELTVEELVQQERGNQVSANMTMRHIITSMRTLAVFDWRDFVENVSLVDACLRQHGGYLAMDFLTRDRYRHAIEDLALHSHYDELAIAKLVIDKFKIDGPTRGSESAEMDPGYCLIGEGRLDFERDVAYRPPLRQRLLRLSMAFAGPAYPVGIEILTMCLLLLLPLNAALDNGLGWFYVVLIGLVAIFPASDIATNLVNRIIVGILPPRHLPRFEFKEGIPVENRTFVVVPTLFVSEEDVERQVGQMEVHYLANRDENIYFALLSDWTDADQERMPDDISLLKKAQSAVADLNEKYSGERRFFVFHRRRQWNASEGKWIGWERKRGKIHEFNRLLRGAIDTSFLPVDGELPLGSLNIRYVITLDADTRLPIGVVNQLVGTAAHPLNRPVFDAKLKRVIGGYGILQPRVSPTLPLRQECSPFHKIFSGACGIDAYSSMVSEVYQDLFGLGSYSGKGLYDVDIFEAALDGRVPENTQLSHDLFESVFARCGHVSDVEFFEDFPSHTDVVDSRSHRWTRGDWQLLPWILRSSRQDMPFLGRWKMIDNLRRSLSAPGAFLTLMAAWVIPGAPQVTLISFVLISLAMPALLALGNGLFSRMKETPLSLRMRRVRHKVTLGLAQGLVDLVLLAHHSWLMVHAIGSTLVRVFFTHRHLLEWVTSLQAKARLNDGLKSLFLRFGSSTWMVLFSGGIIFLFNPVSLSSAAPFLLVWWAAPIFSRWLSLSDKPGQDEAIGIEDARQLRLVGRRTWRFFTTFVTDKDHHLPPDNFQEDPNPVIAHRSSPTNFGLYLLSILAARDFGWIGMIDFVDKVGSTMTTLKKLPRCHGHFYNWYDTMDLRPLEPRYLSTVDSGNLAGHLLTLAQDCREVADQPWNQTSPGLGLNDTYSLLCESFAKVSKNRENSTEIEGIRTRINEIKNVLGRIPGDWNWSRFFKIADELVDLIIVYLANTNDAQDGLDFLEWAKQLRDDVRSHCRDREEVGRSTGIRDRLLSFAEEAERFVHEMDFSFLYDKERNLFALGYRVAEGKIDDSNYDLLASEARLASLIAIAKGDVQSTHWFHLGRRLTKVDSGLVLLSWSGSMFEYLMPSLINFTPRYSLVDKTCRRIIHRQIEYGLEKGVPWGISESALNQRDLEMTYQYSAFGVPGLGLKRGLENDLVIAPYATALAAMYLPHAARKNFLQLENIGALGSFGYYEAIDFTPVRCAEGQSNALVRCYMAHHQGMTLVALDNAVHDGMMRHRFHRIAMIRSVDLLLQERSPRHINTDKPHFIKVQTEPKVTLPEQIGRKPSPCSLLPSTHLLSNGQYNVMITAAGSGYSSWNGLAINRWREDSIRDHWGSYLYLRDMANGKFWSAGFQPTTSAPDAYEAIFLEDRVRLVRRDDDIECSMEVIVSPEDNAEIRYVTMTNNRDNPVAIELTSYTEVVLASLRADIAHPAFSNLFVETEFVPDLHGLVARRRPRSGEDQALWAAHLISQSDSIEGLQYETDRARFVGRGQTLQAPAALIDGRPLSNTVGPTLDPIFSLRTQIQLEAGVTCHLTFITLIAESRQVLIDKMAKYHNPASYERVSAMAWTHGQVLLHHLRISQSESQLFQELANYLIFSCSSLRPSNKAMQANKLSVDGLWRHGISGDHPILLLRVKEVEHVSFVDQLLRAQEYWRQKGFFADFVIINEKGVSYIQHLNDLLEAKVREWRSYHSRFEPAKHGGIFLLRRDYLSEEEHLFLRTAARAVINSDQGSLAEQIKRQRRPDLHTIGKGNGKSQSSSSFQVERGESFEQDLEFFNGFGGFSDGGREYVIKLHQEQWTPAPWINVIANPSFGFLASELGSGCTWSLNSHENKLSPWSNDPVCDPPGEVFYLCDLDTGHIWTPTALPIRIPGAVYKVRHGQGYSCFEHHSHGIFCELMQFVPLEDSVKISRLTISNESKIKRRIRVAAYIEWVLGPSRTVTASHLVTSMDDQTGAMFAINPWSQDFGKRIAFADFSGRQMAWTGSRREFLGRNGTLSSPTSLCSQQTFKNLTGAGLDPCAALEKTLEFEPGEKIEIVFLFGQGQDQSHARQLIERYRSIDTSSVLSEVQKQWDTILNKIQVSTPDRGLDLMLNRWLPYQTLSCRVWGRAGFYQAGGAYGFRDQLQDVMSLVTSCPDLARSHILKAAARQFLEGDVQHWWHPPTGRGVRTRFSDDRIWLPFAVIHYVKITGDHQILEEAVPFLEGPPLEPGREDAYFDPKVSGESASLYEHCARALDVSMGTGRHGLPLMGSGDWNDGMNRVGHHGQGESVWLAWFLIKTLLDFSNLIEQGGDSICIQEENISRISRWRDHASALKRAVEAEAWDGTWYRRAYFDDGTPLGSAMNSECRIDSIAQSWSVMSGAAMPERARRAMHSVHDHLIRHGDDLVLLFTPPFDQTHLDPGYIKGYLPGIRENGGQYTHAAIWAVCAYASLGQGNQATELLRILNPIHRAENTSGAWAYKVEPYVLSADIYSEPPHTRRGGWTWYTGASGWFYRSAMEWVLGLTVRSDRLHFSPSIAGSWPGYQILYRHGKTSYEITVENPQSIERGQVLIKLDGKHQNGEDGILLHDDGLTHKVVVILKPEIQ